MLKSLSKFKNQLIVSCQAVDDEPLNNPIAISLIAMSCVKGGAKVLRLSQIEHIKAVKSKTNVPVIGIIKKHYSNSEVYISPTLTEIKELIKVGVDIIALDATLRKRPKEELTEIIHFIKVNYPKIGIMADCSNEEDVKNAEKLGFDLISTTLRGYTSQTKEMSNIDHDYEFIKWCLKNVKTPIVAEGGICTPQMAKEIKELGVFAVVVGSAITRPQVITEKFLQTFEN